MFILKNLRLLLGFVLMHLCVIGSSQNSDTPIIQKGDISVGKILSEKEYTGKSLWGYINGGADLYLEYGFEKLTVQEIDKDEVLLKVNIYKMEDAEAAFGIFSVNVHKCKNRDVILKNDCQGAYQYQAFKSKYYISIINEKGDSTAEKVSKDVAEILINKIDDKEFEYPELFLLDPFIGSIDKLKFMKGRLGLQNGYPALTDSFEGLKDYSVWILSLENVKLALIDFNSEDDRISFLSKLGNETKYWKIQNKGLILIDPSSNSSDKNKYFIIIEDYIKDK